MRELFKAVSQSPEIELIFCTPEAQWEQHRHEYNEYLSSNIKIVHKVGNELLAIYKSIDITMLFVKQHDYWEFAVPVKLYEYMGHGKPVIGSKGGQIEKIINQYSAGWCVEYSSEALKKLLSDLQLNKAQISTTSKKLCETHSIFSWNNRAEEVITYLSELES